MKRLFKYTLPIIALCALAACSDDTTNEFIGLGPDGNKALIDFAGDGSSISRASLTRAGFKAQTKIEMRIKAEEVTASSPGLPARYAKATATATAEIPASNEGADSHSSLVGAHSDLDYDNGQERYWDDAFGRNSKLTVYAFAIPNRTDATLPAWSEEGWTKVDATTNPNWYTGTEYTSVTWNVSTVQTATTWSAEDLAYSNNIKTGGTGGRYTYTYEGSSPKTLKTTLEMGNGPMIWQPKTDEVGVTTGKFDQGHLIFNHALAWIEVYLKEGDGFNNGETTDFLWTKNKATATQNITLKHFNTNGTFDVSSGTWTAISATNNITQMYEQDITYENTGKSRRQLFAYVLPGNNLFDGTNANDNVIEFEIDNAQYYVKGRQIADAIRDFYKEGGDHEGDSHASDYRSFKTIEAGKHYVINLTVAKKGIDRVTAAIVDWENVNSNDADAKNTYPVFAFEDRGTRYESASAPLFNIYRAEQTAANYITGLEDKNFEWSTGYRNDGAATKTWDTTNSEWETTWYWPNNLTYYHFRAAGYTENASGTPTIALSNSNPTTFPITSGTIGGGTYKDYIWGAPFVDIEDASTGQLTYSTTTGFDNQDAATHQISQAIGATESQINMLLFHMTSQITVNVTTTTDANKVSLYKAAEGGNPEKKTKVEILNFRPNGTVRMGDGLVETTTTASSDNNRKNADMAYGTRTAGSESVAEKVDDYKYGIVPQVLTWTEDIDNPAGTIGLRITTPDGNQYLVRDLSTCTATIQTTNLANPYTLASGSDTNYTINQWYPNFKYTYNIAISKKGIDRITAAVVPWETVTGDLGTIDLEN